MRWCFTPPFSVLRIFRPFCNCRLAARGCGGRVVADDTLQVAGCAAPVAAVLPHLGFFLSRDLCTYAVKERRKPQEHSEAAACCLNIFAVLIKTIASFVSSFSP